MDASDAQTITIELEVEIEVEREHARLDVAALEVQERASTPASSATAVSVKDYQPMPIRIPPVIEEPVDFPNFKTAEKPVEVRKPRLLAGIRSGVKKVVKHMGRGKVSSSVASAGPPPRRGLAEITNALPSTLHSERPLSIGTICTKNVDTVRRSLLPDATFY